MSSQKRTLNILMNGILVGHLENKKGALTYTYTQSWLDTPGARPISLSLPLGEQKFSGNLVYNFFDNLLPDNAQIRARIQTKFQAPTNHPFDLLAVIGKDCVGAIQLLEDENPIYIKQIKAQPLDNKEIAAILRGYQKYPLGMVNKMDDFRISLAGIQEKSGFLYHNDQWSRPQGITPTSHIFKLPIGFNPHQLMDLNDSCENEWLCSLIMSAFELPVAKSKIVYFEDVKTLVVERFDRRLSQDKTWLMRLPQEDMCQALSISSNLKYQADGGPGIKSIMNFLLGSSNPEKDRENFFRVQVLFWLLAAIDGHAKNFSIFIEPESKFHLTPFYDIISAYPLIEKKLLPKQKIKMAMALKGENNHYHWYNVSRRNLISAAKDAGFSLDKANCLIDEILDKTDFVIEQVALQLPSTFPEYIAKSIFLGMRDMKEQLR